MTQFAIIGPNGKSQRYQIHNHGGAGLVDAETPEVVKYWDNRETPQKFLDLSGYGRNGWVVAEAVQ